MANWQQATVKSIHWWNKKQFSVVITAQLAPFKAGQFTKLALDIQGKRIARAYSFVNAPSTNEHEFFLIKVDDGCLSTSLAQLSSGDIIDITPNASGFFTIDEVPKSDHLWLFATGTAIGPFISMLRDGKLWQKFKTVTLVHGVRYCEDLAYVDELNLYIEQGYDFNFVPVISRESEHKYLRGRIPKLIQSSELPSMRSGKFVNNSQFMICGNPDMVKDTTQVLLEMGYKRNRRREPGQITVEQYW